MEESHSTEKLRKGLIPLVMRQGVIMGIGLVSQLFMTRMLSPVDFGFAASALIVLGVAKLFNSGGIGIYLIQRKSAPLPGEVANILALQTIVFLVGQCAVFSLFALGFIPALIAQLLNFTLLTIPITLLRGAYIVDLERQLNYGAIARADITDQATSGITLMLLLFLGAGVWSIPVAATAGLVISGYLLSRQLNAKADWTINLSNLRTKETWKGISFGLWYLAPNMVGAARAAALPVILGGMAGAKEVGLADRAGFIAGLPLMLLSGIQQKALFSFSARAQDNLKLVRSTLSTSIYVGAVLDKLLFLPLAIFPHELFAWLLPGGWVECIPVMSVFLIGNVLFGSLASPTYPVLNGLGRSATIAWMSVATTAITWVLLPIMIVRFGIIGYAYNSLILWGAIPLYYFYITKIVGPVEVIPVLKPLVAFMLTVGFFEIIRHQFPTWICILSWLSLCLYIGISQFLYLSILFAFDRKRLISLWSIFKVMVHRNSP